MRPVLVEIFGVTFGSYRTCLTIAFLVGTFLAVHEVQRRNEGYYLSPVAGIWAFFGALLGARTFYMLQYEELAEVWRAVLVWQGGLVFHGGLAGAILAVTIYLRFCRIPWWKAFDVFAALLPLGQAITRIGCYLNSCCHGTPTEVRWAVQFPLGSDVYIAQFERGIIDAFTPQPLPVHPTQLYMVAGLVAMFVALRFILDRRPADGIVVFSYLGLYGLLRFAVEFLRGDNDAVLAGLTLYQLISIALVLIAVAGLVVIRRRGAAEAATDELSAHPSVPAAGKKTKTSSSEKMV